MLSLKKKISEQNTTTPQATSGKHEFKNSE